MEYLLIERGMCIPPMMIIHILLLEEIDYYSLRRLIMFLKCDIFGYRKKAYLF